MIETLIDKFTPGPGFEPGNRLREKRLLRTNLAISRSDRCAIRAWLNTRIATYKLYPNLEETFPLQNADNINDKIRNRQDEQTVVLVLPRKWNPQCVCHNPDVKPIVIIQIHKQYSYNTQGSSQPFYNVMHEFLFNYLYRRESAFLFYFIFFHFTL